MAGKRVFPASWSPCLVHVRRGGHTAGRSGPRHVSDAIWNTQLCEASDDASPSHRVSAMHEGPKENHPAEPSPPEEQWEKMSKDCLQPLSYGIRCSKAINQGHKWIYPCNAFPSEKSERIYSPELEIRELHSLTAFSGRKRNLGARSPRTF